MSILSPRDVGLPAKFTAFRSGQDSLALDLASAASTSRFLMINMPTGGGKSVTSITIALLIGGSYAYLVSSKELQRQLYADGYHNLVNIYGHSHYPCADSSTSDDGGFEFECTAGAACCYRPLVDQITAPSPCNPYTTNYDHWLAIGKSDDPARLGNPNVLILDEAHLIHDKLVSHVAFTVTHRQITSLLGSMQIPAKTDDISTWQEWAVAARSKARERYTELSALRKKKGGTPHPSLSASLQKVTRLGKSLSRLADRPPSCHWIVIPGDTYKTRDLITLSPVWGRDYAEQYLYRGCPHVILSSATLQESAIEYLGIPSSDYQYRDVESTFSPKRRPFVFVPGAGRIRGDIGEGEKRILVREMDKVIAETNTSKALIQPRSYDRAQWIHDLSCHSAQFITYKSGESQAALQRFISEDSSISPFNAILNGPSFEEGVDLFGPRCRRQFCPKIPFPDTRSPLMAARCKEDKLYRNRLAAETMEQMPGRSTRFELDWSVFYLFDANWIWFQDAPGVKFSRSFRRSWVRVRTTDEAIEVYLKLERQAGNGTG